MSRCILIIDDEEDIRTIATVSIETVGGWRSLSAASGSEGLAIAQSQQLDAILLDVMMPEMDGVEVFQHLRTHPKTQTIPVILLTAKVQAADQRKLSELGTVATIPKPFNPLTLPDEIARILHW